MNNALSKADLENLFIKADNAICRGNESVALAALATLTEQARLGNVLTGGRLEERGSLRVRNDVANYNGYVHFAR